ncbi:hypothetical protein CIRG_00932 [Coccidioides immitis RMSCC 2394]|uniref:Uncharacterized protein n=1 Tax=Coccidioides immitis RMSCC 2394 TaxID=404692 RepID=A0A0J6XZG7_COCIT|nr:hypothetical protein CIRG_00932 [Coccidioides immitis RMSCC 2394]
MIINQAFSDFEMDHVFVRRTGELHVNWRQERERVETSRIYVVVPKMVIDYFGRCMDFEVGSADHGAIKVQNRGETITKGKSGSAASPWGINVVLEVAQTRLHAHGREAHLVQLGFTGQ